MNVDKHGQLILSVFVRVQFWFLVLQYSLLAAGMCLQRGLAQPAILLFQQQQDLSDHLFNRQFLALPTGDQFVNRVTAHLWLSLELQIGDRTGGTRKPANLAPYGGWQTRASAAHPINKTKRPSNE
jgi:hypothetical protein